MFILMTYRDAGVKIMPAARRLAPSAMQKAPGSHATLAHDLLCPVPHGTALSE